MKNKAKDWAVIAGGVLLVLTICYAVYWFEVNHPCIRWENQTCSDTTCVWHMKTGTGPNAPEVCTQWQTRTYTCKQCVERK